MITKIIDLLFPKCEVYSGWGHYLGKKRIFILIYLWNRR